MHRPLLAFASALIVLFGILAAPARADDTETCKKSDGDDALAACTRLISSKTLRGGELAQAYLSRGLIYIVSGRTGTAPSPTTTRRSSSIRKSPAPIPDAPPPTSAKATSIAHCRT